MRSFIVAGLLCVVAAGGAGCATILKGGDSWGQVQFRNTPDLQGDHALQVWVDGKPHKWKMAFSKAQGDTVVSEPTVDLSTKSSHEVRVAVGGCESTFTIKPSVSGWWIVLDLTVGLGIGIVVDWITGSWADFGDDAIIYLPGLMQRAGRPVAGQQPQIACGSAAAQAALSPVTSSGGVAYAGSLPSLCAPRACR